MLEINVKKKKKSYIFGVAGHEELTPIERCDRFFSFLAFSKQDLTLKKTQKHGLELSAFHFFSLMVLRLQYFSSSSEARYTFGLIEQSGGGIVMRGDCGGKSPQATLGQVHPPRTSH